MNKLTTACNKIEDIEIQLATSDERITPLEYQMMDMGARPCRHNLIFNNLNEPEGEDDAACENLLIDFIAKELKMGENAKEIVFQRVHRLG